ncbi:hypothetical protein SmJEL517_g05904 [Synchytrium microbalum]|uniref:RRM domain-containing protein n=1 Tax=Synchytrium microbalum TaxID=1806994 RepID=A0A507BYZ9_9FUNG|nr:uncharacterized protein SmJEL517_g05904 [Synchytrium microbalum]TPX30565.1 hypothetical protein SmJEL517_g05904 [Synchytrium microbalum]
MSYRPGDELPAPAGDIPRDRARSRSPRRDSGGVKDYEYPDPYHSSTRSDDRGGGAPPYYGDRNGGYGYGYNDRYDDGYRGGYDDRNNGYDNGGSYDNRRDSGRYDSRYDSGGGGRYDSGGGRSNRGYRDSRHSSPRPRREIIKGAENDRATTTTLFVGNLPYRFEERDISELFGRYGPIKSISVPFDRHTGRNKGFSFVEFEDRRDAQDAFEKVQGFPVDGRKLKLDWDVGLQKKDELKGRTSAAPSDRGRGDRRDSSSIRGDDTGGGGGGSRTFVEPARDPRLSNAPPPPPGAF